MGMKYIVNHVIAGYYEAPVDDTRLVDRNNTDGVAVVLDSTTSDRLKEYYDPIKNILLSGVKLILIVVNKESNIRKPIANLMASYRNYNIYKINSVDILDRMYVDNLFARQPDAAEVQQFIGGDITAYSDLGSVLAGINELVNMGDIEALKTLIESHRETIEHSNEVLDFMKMIVDQSNSNDLVSTISTLRNKLDNAENQNTENQKDLRDLRATADNLRNKLNDTQRDLNKANARIGELENSKQSGSSVMDNYTTLVTSQIKTTCTYVIYFKEISYVRYMNSLVSALYKLLETKYKTKLLVYDNKVGLPYIYRPLSVIGSTEYLANKSNFISSVAKMVISEPNPIILENILTSITPQFDVVIVYDRMRQQRDLVSGNNVAKVFVVNSSSELEETRKFLNVRNTDLIISGPGSSIAGALDIPVITGYDQSTATAKLSKYKKAVTKNGVKIVQAILDKARIQFGNE